MPDSLTQLFNPKTIIYTGGMGLLMLMVFAETGLLVGIVFPGDSLLFTAGLLTAVDVVQLPYGLVIAGIAVSAFAGDQSGYWIGWRAGKAFFHRPKSLFFRPEYVQMTKDFYSKYGAWILILGKFLPIIRTFAPLLAGVIHMPYFRFLLMSATGSLAWPAVLVSLGYFLGGLPLVQKYYEWIILVMVLITTGPVLWRILFSYRKKVSTQS